MGEWKEYRLGDLIDVKHGFAFKGECITQEPTNDILVTPGNFRIGGGFKDSKFKYYKGDYPEEYVLKEGDVVVTMTDLSQEGDTLGYSARIPSQKRTKFLHNQRIGLIKVISHLADKDFLYWIMRTSDYQSFIVGAASGTSIRHTSPSSIKEYKFELPPLPEQRAIASILSSLDDKTDLLHRQNKTLEALAETLFRQWFVEEAVNNKQIPLGELVDVIDNRGKTPPFSIVRTDYPIIEVKSLASSGKFVDYDACEKYVSEETYYNWFRAGHPTIGDILFSTVGSIGEMAFVIENKGAIAQNVIALRPKNISSAFLYQFLSLKQTKNLIMSLDIGAVQPSIKVPHLLELEVPVPVSTEQIEYYDSELDSLFGKMRNNHNQIRTLTQLRDTLLPKLMSGEVRVRS